MFESNTDLEFDEIFGGSFQPNKSEAPKRTFENENSSNEPNKKSCVDRTVPIRSMMFLRKIEESSNNISFESYSKPSVSSSRLQSKSEPVRSPLRQDSFHSHTKKVVLRKFPGPAGLLPERKDFNIKALDEVNNKETKQVEMDICSQLSVRAFRGGLWEQMCKDFSSPAALLPDKYTIAWIKAKMKSNKLINQKAPFLAAIIQKIECLKLKTPVVTMILKDATGQIHGTIVHDLYEEYINVLKVGSVVILKQFGVLTTDRGSNHYLTITVNNLVTIYSEETTNQSDLVSHEDPSRNEVNITVVQKLSVEDFLKNISEVKSRHKAALLEQNLNFEGDFGSVPLHLKTLTAGSLGGRTDFVRMQTGENESIQRDKPITPNSRTLNAKNTRFSNGDAKPNTNLSSNFKNTQFFNVSNNSPVNCNNENNASSLSSSSSKQRFHCKRVTPIITNSFIESKPCLGIPGHNTDFVIMNNSNTNKSKQLEINEDNGKLSHSMLNNNDGVIKCSQISVSSDNVEHSAILQNLFEGIDADALFEDF